MQTDQRSEWAGGTGDVERERGRSPHCGGMRRRIRRRPRSSRLTRGSVWHASAQCVVCQATHVAESQGRQGRREEAAHRGLQMEDVQGTTAVRDCGACHRGRQPGRSTHRLDIRSANERKRHTRTVFAHSRAEGLATAARVTPRPRYPAAVLHRPLQALMARRLVAHLIARGHRVARARWLGRPRRNGCQRPRASLVWTLSEAPSA